MIDQPRSALGSALAWMIFPIVPVVAASTYHSTVNFTGDDPRQWSLLKGVVLLGPLAGYGYLAGATLRLGDHPSRKGMLALLRRRSIWLGLGPWLGLLTLGALVLISRGLDWVLVRVLAPDRLEAWHRATSISSPGWLADDLIIAFLAYGWLLVAWAVGRRARRQAQLWSSIARGLVYAFGFLGSLLGGFWAATSLFRAYFFDSRVAQVFLIAGLSLLLASGCAPPPTVGDVRRRELFQAMIMAWVLGLALVWRWLARERK
jgi:hypothetical protein